MVDADAEERIVVCELQRLDDAVGVFEEACARDEAEDSVGLVEGVLNWGGATFVVVVVAAVAVVVVVVAVETVDMDLFAQGYCKDVASRGDREAVLGVPLVPWRVGGGCNVHRLMAYGPPSGVQ